MSDNKNCEQRASDTVEPIVRLNQHLDALERIADKFPYSDDRRFDAVQRTIMDILVSEGRYEVAPNALWRKPNKEHSGDAAASAGAGVGRSDSL